MGKHITIMVTSLTICDKTISALNLADGENLNKPKQLGSVEVLKTRLQEHGSIWTWS